MNDLPPGLEGPLDEVVSGTHAQIKERDWMTYETTKLFTNAFIFNKDSGKILLGYKKRGFGMGLYNGFGGKVEAGETAADAALRELKEEAGVEAKLTPCGTLLFYTEGYAYAYLIKIFSANDCQGDPVETDEMRPEWFSIPPEYRTYVGTEPQLPPIPLDRMWQDDRLWMPLMFSRQSFSGRVDFAKLNTDDAEAEMVKWWFGTVE